MSFNPEDYTPEEHQAYHIMRVAGSLSDASKSIGTLIRHGEDHPLRKILIVLRSEVANSLALAAELEVFFSKALGGENNATITTD